MAEGAAVTPLAQLITRSLVDPGKADVDDEVGLRHRMWDVHCFDLSHVWRLQDELAEQLVERRASPGEFAFLPAPRTWIEWSRDNQERTGFLLIQQSDGSALVFCAVQDVETDTALKPGRAQSNRFWLSDGYTAYDSFFKQSEAGAATLGLNCSDERYWQQCIDINDTGDGVILPSDQALLYAALTFINTPRLLGRRQHMPHRGLERALLKSRRTVGAFPLNAYTEIVLPVGTPHDASGDVSTEAHLTGARALHFCRAHLRIRMGKPEIVRSHWRGDASLGIRRSRYRLTSEGPTAWRRAER